jgi:hypothetical protein
MFASCVYLASSVYRIPLIILCNAGLVVVNSFNLCLSWKVTISPLILKDHFALLSLAVFCIFDSLSKICHGGNLFFFFVVLELELRTSTLRHSTSPFFVMGFFQDRVLWTICSGWLWNIILLVSASLVGRITGMSHWRPAWWGSYMAMSLWFWILPVLVPECLCLFWFENFSAIIFWLGLLCL